MDGVIRSTVRDKRCRVVASSLPAARLKARAVSVEIYTYWRVTLRSILGSTLTSNTLTSNSDLLSSITLRATLICFQATAGEHNAELRSDNPLTVTLATH
jgi:hypothetical protein